MCRYQDREAAIFITICGNSWSCVGTRTGKLQKDTLRIVFIEFFPVKSDKELKECFKLLDKAASIIYAMNVLMTYDLCISYDPWPMYILWSVTYDSSKSRVAYSRVAYQCFSGWRFRIRKNTTMLYWSIPVCTPLVRIQHIYALWPSTEDATHLWPMTCVSMTYGPYISLLHIIRNIRRGWWSMPISSTRMRREIKATS